LLPKALQDATERARKQRFASKSAAKKTNNRAHTKTRLPSQAWQKPNGPG